MVSTPVPRSFLLYPCRVPLSFLLHPCHSEEHSGEESAVLVWFLREADFPLARLSFRGAKRRGIFCFSFGLLRISRFARNDNNNGSLRIRLSASSVRY